jgi:acylphosphatase
MTVHLAPHKVTIRLVIHSRVQGALFRESMRHESQKLAVTGWVRNRGNGMVEAVVHGEATAVDAIVRWVQCCSELTDAKGIEIVPDNGRYPSFEIIG